MANRGLCSACGLWYEQDHQHTDDHDCLKATQVVMRELGQGIEDLIAVATTDVDGEGIITAYHFKTGALHRLLSVARQVPGVLQHAQMSGTTTGSGPKLRPDRIDTKET